MDVTLSAAGAVVQREPSVSIRLLGRPSVTIDGRPAAGPRGLKAWALLAYLLLSHRPVSRRQLAELLFGEADDPLGALRWSLAELRRTLGDGVGVTGDPVELEVSEAVEIDVRHLVDVPADADLLGLDGEFLEGVTATGTLETWLVVERHRISSVLEALLRRAALRSLAAGSAGQAAAFALRAVAQGPFDEGNHVLLVRCLAATGDRKACLEQVQVSAEVFRRELGIDVAPVLRAAARSSASPTAVSVSGRASALTQLEAGRAAIVAGAVDAGVECLRRAVHEADQCGDRQLVGRCLAALGGALVHAMRGADDEGAIVLLQALEIADAVGDRSIAALANRELGFIDVQAGRRCTANGWLAAAEELADDDGELAAVLGIRGMSASDAGDYPAAFDHLERSIVHACRAGDERQEAWSLSILGRAYLLRGDDARAEQVVERSLELVHAQRWLAFLPWPQALHGELELRSGHDEAAAATFEQSWALACQLGDLCWEGMAARGLAFVSVGRADLAGASSWIEEARTRCCRVSDRYQWVHATVLDAVVGIAIRNDRFDEARATNEALAALAARGEMRELLACSYAHRARLGEPAELAVAWRLAAEIDNPALMNRLADGTINGS